MRTTITLDPDVAVLVEREMKARDLRFKDVVNDALRSHLGGASRPDLVYPTHDLGAPIVDLVHANRLAEQLEDAELARKLAERR